MLATTGKSTSPVARSEPITTRLKTRPSSSNTDSHSSCWATLMMVASWVNDRMIQGAPSAAASASEPEASMPLRTPLRTMASASFSRPAPSMRPTMISQPHPMAMLMSNTYLSVCRV